MNESVKIDENVKEDFKKDLQNYRKTMFYMSGNVPIQVLCLPKEIENSLIRADFIRVYDLFGIDLTEIKGIGRSRASLLATRLDEFFTVSI